jgi:hypothetical protein
MLKLGILDIHPPLVAMLLASSVVFSGAQSASPQSSQNSSSPAAAPANSAAAAHRATPTQAAAPAQPSASAASATPVWRGSEANRLPQRAEMYYQGVWGVSELRVKTAESGQLIRFNYRVLDPVKAAALNNTKVEPKLFDAQAGVSLVVPQLEKVGKLRQSSTPKAGMTYWMAFSNPTLAVKRGHRVDVVIGGFRANNLVVE